MREKSSDLHLRSSRFKVGRRFRLPDNPTGFRHVDRENVRDESSAPPWTISPVFRQVNE